MPRNAIIGQAGCMQQRAPFGRNDPRHDVKLAFQWGICGGAGLQADQVLTNQRRIFVAPNIERGNRGRALDALDDADHFNSGG